MKGSPLKNFAKVSITIPFFGVFSCPFKFFCLLSCNFRFKLFFEAKNKCLFSHPKLFWVPSKSIVLDQVAIFDNLQISSITSQKRQQLLESFLTCPRLMTRQKRYLTTIESWHWLTKAIKLAERTKSFGWKHRFRIYVSLHMRQMNRCLQAEINERLRRKPLFVGQ